LKELAVIVSLAAVLSLACGSPSSPSASGAATGTYGGSYSYPQLQSGPSTISGTLSFELATSDISEIRNVRVVASGCEKANVQAESVLVPLGGSGNPGRSDRHFTIALPSGVGGGVTVDCGWDLEHKIRDRATCGMATAVNNCGVFGGSASQYGFTVSKQP
jgi:hypothetical protein